MRGWATRSSRWSRSWRSWTTRIQELLATLPNLPDPSAPDGDSEEDAEVLREVGEPPEFGFEPRDHLELGTRWA